MCLAIPCLLAEIKEEIGVVDYNGVRREISLVLMEDVTVGDYLIVHSGFAVQKMDPSAMRESIRILSEPESRIGKEEH